MINEKTIVSSLTLIGSLTSYFYAKTVQKDTLPFVLVGSFIGAMLGEAISGIVLKNDKPNEEEKKEEDQNKEE